MAKSCVGILVAPVAALLGLVLGYFLAAAIAGMIPVNRDFAAAADGVDVYIRSNGVHTDLVVPVSAEGTDWRGLLPIEGLGAETGVGDFLAFGWGDREFYLSTPTWADLRVSTAVKAVAGFDTTVVHVEAIGVPPFTGKTRHVRLSAGEYQRLVRYLEGSFQRDGEGRAEVIPGAHYDAYDEFFEARGHYSLFVTCNEWARRGLAVAGVRTALWAPFDVALFWQLDH